MNNPFEEFINSELEIIKQNNKNPTKGITDLEFLRANIILTELYPMSLKFPDADLTPIFEKVIYIECRQRGYEPNNALEETKRQIKERKK